MIEVSVGSSVCSLDLRNLFTCFFSVVLGRTQAPALLFLCLVELCAGHSVLKASYDMRANESNQSPLKDDCLPTTCMWD